MILFSMFVLLIIGYYFDIFILSEPILYVIMYVWSRKEPDTMSNIFGFKFKSIYLPWVYVGIRMLMGGSVIGPLVGIAVGHLYYFLIEVLPLTHGYNLIHTPQFCMDVMNYVSGSSISSSQQQQQQQSHTPFAGTAHTLGGNQTQRPGGGIFARMFGQQATPTTATTHSTGSSSSSTTGLRHRGGAAATNTTATNSSSSNSGFQWGSSRGRTLGSS